MKPLIWIESIIEKFSHSRVEIMVKVPTNFFFFKFSVNKFLRILCDYSCIIFFETSNKENSDSLFYIMPCLKVLNEKKKIDAVTKYAMMLCWHFRQRDSSKNSLWQIMWRWESPSLVMPTPPSLKQAREAPNMSQRRTWWCGPSSLFL